MKPIKRESKTRKKELQYDAKQLQSIFNAYKLHRKSNDVLIKRELIKGGQNAGLTADIQINKPLTIASFCLFADIEIHTFYRYVNRAHQSYPAELCKVFSRIQTEIKDEQISGAIVGLYDSRIVGKLNNIDTDDKPKEQERETVVINIGNKSLNLQINKRNELQQGEHGDE